MIWEEETRRIFKLFATYALLLLDSLSEEDTWKGRAILVDEPVISEIETRSRISSGSCALLTPTTEALTVLPTNHTHQPAPLARHLELARPTNPIRSEKAESRSIPEVDAHEVALASRE